MGTWDWAMVARLIVTLALLVFAIVWTLVQPTAQGYDLAATIVGACIGYWLGHADPAKVRPK